MANTTKKMMSLELEFVDPTAHGFVSWVDFDTGEVLASLGLGSTAKDIGFNDEGEQEGVPNGGAKYLEWNLEGVDFIKVTGGGIQFDEQRSLEILSTRDIIEFGEVTGTEDYTSSIIHLNNSDYTAYETASTKYEFDPDNPESNESIKALELQEIKSNYEDKTNAMILEHENAIAFTNPVTGRIMGLIDNINEAFVWYGAFSLGEVVSDSYFEIKRNELEKLNFTLNAATDFNPSIGFKYEDSLTWLISVDTENNVFNIKNTSGHGIELLSSEDAVKFTGEIYYQDTPLLNFFYTQDQLSVDGVLDDRYYTETELDGGQLDIRYYTQDQLSVDGVLDDRYYTETELDGGQLDIRYYIQSEVDILLTQLENNINTNIDTLRQETELRLQDLEQRILYVEQQAGVSLPQVYIYIDGSGWTNMTNTLIKIDEEYDMPMIQNALEDDLLYAEAERTYHRYTSGSWIQQNDFNQPELPRVFVEGDIVVFRTGDIYEWSNNSWSKVFGDVEDYYLQENHLSDISNPVEGQLYRINATDKFYLYTDGEFVLQTELDFIDGEASLPSQYNWDNKVIII